MSLEGYRQNVSYRLRDLAEALGTTSEDFSRAAGIALDASGAASPEAMHRLQDMIDILEQVGQRFPSLSAAYAWYRSVPLPGHSGQTAMQLVLAGRITDLREYVDALDTGVHA